MPLIHFEEKLTQIEEYIRIGDYQHARHELHQAVQANIPQDLRISFASIARRLDRPMVGVRLLNSTLSTDAAIAEYSASLVKLGATKEAIKRLEGVKAQICPEALLFLAFANIKEWNYANSIQIYKNYIASRGLNDYQRLVGRVNLAAALVQEKKFADAEKELKELRLITKDSNRKLLYINCLQFSAELELIQGNLIEAEKYAIQCKKELAGFSDGETFAIDKLFGKVQVKRNRASRASLEKLSFIKAEAVAKKYWESVRELDFFECQETGSKDALQKLYFGTRFPAFRERLKKIAPLDFENGKSYLWKLPPFEKQGLELKLLNGEKLTSGEKLKVGQSMHRLLMGLTGDFYRPFTLISLSESVFPNENFHPVKTPERMHQIVIRLRKFLEKNRIPLSIIENAEEYRLLATAPCGIYVSDYDRKETWEFGLNQIQSKLPNGFTASEAAKILELSTDSALLILKKAIQEKKVIRQGLGKSTRYYVQPNENDLKRAA